MITRRALLGSSILAVAMPAHAISMPVYRDRDAPEAARVADLLGRMTIEEKAAQLRCAWQMKRGFQNSNGDFDASKAETALAHGLGQIARVSDLTGVGSGFEVGLRSAANMVQYTNAAQRFSHGSPRSRPTSRRDG